MGFFFRRSLGFGPFRVNLSKSGVGWSVGGRGLRVGVDPRGRKRTTVSIPGTGVGYRTGGGRGSRGCLLALAVPVAMLAGAAAVAAHAVLS